jgi:pimeloyl-ACP methyl ester carboxylesterase
VIDGRADDGDSGEAPASPDVSSEPAADRRIVLPDGRAAAYAEWGDPDGQPIFLLHGMPGSRLLCPDVAASVAARVRLISLDRPGYGGSDPQPDRRIVDGADDIAAIADRLGIDRYSVIGWSSGGPYALACAVRDSARVTAVATVAGDAPTEETPELLDELPPHVQSRVAAVRRGERAALEDLRARLAPFAADPDLIFGGPPSPDRGPDGRMRSIPAVGAAMSTMIREAFRQGTTGYVEDWVATFLPWGFRLADVRGPVTIWWGDEDPLVSRAHAEKLAGGVPDARLAVVRGGGHSIAFAEWRSILASVDVRPD